MMNVEGESADSDGDANAGDDYHVDDVNHQELLCDRLHLLAAHRGRPAGGRPGHTHNAPLTLFFSRLFDIFYLQVPGLF